MPCKICETRRPRRFCPGVGGDICSICCGTERENTVSCPLDCEYLQEARAREKPAPVKREDLPHSDIRVSDRFMEDNNSLIGFVAQALAEAGLSVSGAVDFDIRAALDSLVRTYRTRESGLYYESRPANLVAAQIHDHVQKRFEELRRELAERSAGAIRDADVLGALVVLAQLEFRLNNGRRRGRAFLDFVRGDTTAAGIAAPQPSGSGLILP